MITVYPPPPRKRKVVLITITNSIVIAADVRTVFNFLADLRNDQLWRKEINATIMSSRPQLNVSATESSYLSRRTPNHILNLICVEFIKNEKVVYKTIPNSRFFLKSVRQVEAVGENQTKVTYYIRFDKGIAKEGLGFNLPTCIVKYAAMSDMKTYLRTLKRVLGKSSE